MYRRGVHLINDANWLLTSYGNGAAYRLCCIPARREVFLQGDDAQQFNAELEALIDRLGIVGACRELWAMYETAAAPDLPPSLP